MTFLQCALVSTRRMSSKSSMIKPPLSVYGIEGRYATALYSAAVKEKKLEAVEKDLIVLKDLIKKDQKFCDFILNPLLKANVKIDVLKKSLAQKNFSPLTLNLLMALSENGRLKLLVSLVDCFSSIMSNIRGEVVCEVITAKPLDSATLTEFEKTLKGFVKKNEKVLLKSQVDPSIIGGAVISIGDKYVDMSIASKIKVYNATLREVV